MTESELKLIGQLAKLSNANEELQAENERLRQRNAELEAELAEWNPDETKPYSVAFSRLLKVDSRHYVYDTKTRQAVEYYSNPYHAKAEAKRLNDITTSER